MTGKSKQPLSIVWFRRDLRLADNPALGAAAQKGKVLPIFILDDNDPPEQAPNEAGRVWLHHSLKRLNKSLDGKLCFYQGDPLKLFKALCRDESVESVFFNRVYEPGFIDRDKQVTEYLQSIGISVESFNRALLWEPGEILNKSGSSYRVFTPFYKKGCLNAAPPATPVDKPAKITVGTPDKKPLHLDELQLLPRLDWADNTIRHWEIGEAGAMQQLIDFQDDQLANYPDARDIPALDATSRLSPHLHFGEISPHQVWHQIHQREYSDSGAHFLRELAWREFSYYQLYHFPKLDSKAFNPKYDDFKWREDDEGLRAWQQGKTGIPIVDAGMRELWQTGYMHNRVRMIVASFLTKNLLIDWRKGADWFNDCLFDADLANNSASWQWCAGCGADAAPYFRIFNPVLQSEKFDPKAEYILRYCPELTVLPEKFRHKPWMADEKTCKRVNFKPGHDYPRPIVDLKTSRQRALDWYRRELDNATEADEE